MPDLGYVVIDGRKFPLREVRLTGGGLLISFAMHGPQPLLRGNVTLFGEDGQGIAQGHELVFPALRRWDTWVVTYQLHVERIENWDSVQDFRLPSERSGE